MAFEPRSYPFWGLMAALAGFLSLQAAAYLHAGVFEYPLDDVYIHLAMAANIAKGTYGVNAGEAASAASSILYPFLLVPFPETELQRMLPLFWNTLAVAGAGWVWGWIVSEAGLAGLSGGAVAVAGPVLLNVSGVGYTGMEAAPHLLASLMIVLGLWRALTGRGVAAWFIAAAIAAPLLRYEGLALALGAAAVLALRGEVRAAALIAIGGLGGVMVFSLFLTSIGLDPIPGSILAKKATLGEDEGLAFDIAFGIYRNLIRPAGALLWLLVLAGILFLLAFPALRRGPVVWLLVLVLGSAVGHLVFGQIGWMHRYEPYVLASLVGTILLASTALTGGYRFVLQVTAMTAGLAAGMVYLPGLWGDYVWNPRAIHLQQAQMARFAQDYVKAPVAVNDLGRVAWGNPSYVLDIWGLGSTEARDIRLDGKDADGWAGPLAASHSVRLAMIYDSWFGRAAGAGWVRIGRLEMERERGALGDFEVSFYATDTADAADLRVQLAAFAPTLPADARLTILEVAQ
ncbi:MAG: hypothetical protein KDE08_14205 [Rhodobacteraceae bacterium]|nr:hypothetical protein [Paracoccaceae bacterium]